MASSCVVQQQLNSGREPLPASQFPIELFPSLARQRVELRCAAEAGILPFRCDPSLMFQTMKGWIEGALADGEDLAGEQLDLFGDAPAVRGFTREQLENQQIEGSLQQIRWFWHPMPRLSTTIPRLSTPWQVGRRR